MTKYACLWSGGKDSCFAGYCAMRVGLEVSCLVNFAGEDGWSRSHGLPAGLLAYQVGLIGLPIVQPVTNRGGYEKTFKATFGGLKASYGISGVVAGDLELWEHREWLERVCAEVGMDLLLPLWQWPPWAILDGFAGAGFRTIIVAVKADILGKEWLGRELTRDVLDEFRELQRSNGFHPCGESGEYHTLVIDGPLFRRPVTIGKTAPILRDGRWFLEILEYGQGVRVNG